eukprot:366052-Chlamydomonas_euryale.AAC.38
MVWGEVSLVPVDSGMGQARVRASWVWGGRIGTCGQRCGGGSGGMCRVGYPDETDVLCRWCWAASVRQLMWGSWCGAEKGRRRGTSA